MEIQKNISLKQYTTFQIGGNARLFTEPTSSEELVQALRYARDNKVKFFVLGGGSNLLFKDDEYDGIVIHPQIKHLDINENEITVGVSWSLNALINELLKRGFTGLEFAAGIPGAVGGAIRGNAGTYGIGFGDIVKSVTYLNSKKLETATMSHDECVFRYRDSIFKHTTHLIVDSVIIVQKGDVEKSKELISERLSIRKDNHPSEPSAGCVFKNIQFTEADIPELKKREIEIDKFVEHKKLPAGYLIELLGLKGKQIGGAKVSEMHANYIVNTGAATSEDVITLISLIKQQVRDNFNIQLDEEVQLVA